METQTTAKTTNPRKPRRTEAEQLQSGLKDTPRDLKRRHVETRETLTGPEVGVVAWVALVFCSIELGMDLDVWCDKILEIVYTECGTNNNVNTDTYWKKRHKEYVCSGRNDLQITVQETRDAAEEVEATAGKPVVWDEEDVAANEQNVLQVCALKSKENLSVRISEFMRNARENVSDFSAKYGGILGGLYPNHHEIADNIKTVFESVHPAQAVMKSMILSANLVIVMVLEQCFQKSVLVEALCEDFPDELNDAEVELCEADEDSDDEDNKTLGERRRELFENKIKNIPPGVKQLLNTFTQRSEEIESMFDLFTEPRNEEKTLSKKDMDAMKKEETELLRLKETVEKESVPIEDCMADLKKPMNNRFERLYGDHTTNEMLCVLGDALRHLRATNRQRKQECETVELVDIQKAVLDTLI